MIIGVELKGTVPSEYPIITSTWFSLSNHLAFSLIELIISLLSVSIPIFNTTPFEI
ncbi:hypothetical protein ES703_93290 [subsurface metagenome]